MVISEFVFSKVIIVFYEIGTSFLSYDIFWESLSKFSFKFYYPSSSFSQTLTSLESLWSSLFLCLLFFLYSSLLLP